MKMLLKEKLLNLGVNPRLLEMPAVFERLLKEDIDLEKLDENISIMNDGCDFSINIGNREIQCSLLEDGTASYENGIIKAVIDGYGMDKTEMLGDYIDSIYDVTIVERVNKKIVSTCYDNPHAKIYKKEFQEDGNPILDGKFDKVIIGGEELKELVSKKEKILKMLKKAGRYSLAFGEAYDNDFVYENNKEYLTSNYEITKEWFECKDKELGKTEHSREQSIIAQTNKLKEEVSKLQDVLQKVLEESDNEKITENIKETSLEENDAGDER